MGSDRRSIRLYHRLMKRMTLKAYNAITATIREEAFKARNEYCLYIEANKHHHERYAELLDKYRTIPEESVRNSMVEWLQKSGETSIPVWFVEGMTERVNALDFWRGQEFKFECDEENTQRRNGRPPHWVMMIDDSNANNSHHDPKAAKRISAVVNRPKLVLP